ncbi:MAG: hypothetical protein H0S79_03820, partial [Anaerolineaceae bacterium]|nr:hypothetical protein [Anaerolineaceae bacterium]
GFYTKNFSLAERRGLEATKEIVLADEIALLRVLSRRFSGQVLTGQAVPLHESAQYLAVISEAMLRLASLLRTNHMLGGSETGDWNKSCPSCSLKCLQRWVLLMADGRLFVSVRFFGTNLLRELGRGRVSNELKWIEYGILGSPHPEAEWYLGKS